MAAKDEQMKRWCSEVTVETGETWGYAKVPYAVFHGKHFGSFESLRKALAGETGQLVLPTEPEDREVPDPPAGPPEGVVKHFWKVYAAKIPQDAIVLASDVELETERVRNALEQRLNPSNAPPRAFLFFVDLTPEANWAHACAYAFVSASKEVAWCDAEWPPHASIALRLQAWP